MAEWLKVRLENASPPYRLLPALGLGSMIFVGWQRFPDPYRPKPISPPVARISGHACTAAP
jgi:hypothetical protein